MYKKWVWILLIVLGFVTLLGMPFLWTGRTVTGGYYGMMGPGMGVTGSGMGAGQMPGMGPGGGMMGGAGMPGVTAAGRNAS